MILAFKFPARPSFEFYDVIRLPLFSVAEVLLCETIGQPYDVMKSNMAAPEKFVFQQNLKLDCIFNNLTLISLKSGGFL